MSAYTELTRVTLLRDVDEDGCLVSAGLTGTVVYVYPNAEAIIVEFTNPLRTVVTVEADALKPAE